MMLGRKIRKKLIFRNLGNNEKFFVIVIDIFIMILIIFVSFLFGNQDFEGN